MNTACGGIILAGGRARRFDVDGAVDKGLLLLNGQPLVAHSQRMLAPRVGQLLISANRHPDQYGHYGTVCADEPELGAYQGPLAGLASCMSRLRLDWAYVTPVDLPLLSATVYERLWEAAQSSRFTRPLYYVQAARTHPLCMLIHRDVGQQVRQFVADGERRVMHFLQRVQAQSVDCSDLDERVFFNVNTPADLAQIQTVLAGRQFNSL